MYPVRVILDEVGTGEQVHVLSGHAATPALTRRLAEMGLRSGASLRILSRTSGGGAILAIGDDRIAVSAVILQSVTVMRGEQQEALRG
jgi:ferrous iron transport protein A